MYIKMEIGSSLLEVSIKKIRLFKNLPAKLSNMNNKLKSYKI